jgi:hypothetical protein
MERFAGGYMRAPCLPSVIGAGKQSRWSQHATEASSHFSPDCA